MLRVKPLPIAGPIDRFLDKQQTSVKSLFISSYPPRKCGIATFTKDLTVAINNLNPDDLAQIVALDDGSVPYEYPHEVVGRITKGQRSDYQAAAELINDSPAEIVCLQHEYGLFGGGEQGEYALDLLQAINKPIVSTLHTILENPGPDHRRVMGEIVSLSDILITMLPNAKQRLEERYQLNSDRVVVVHHGVADRPKARKALKPKFDWADKKVLLLTGLISAGKGVEYAIQAMPDIVRQFPEALLVVVGQTHPDVLRHDGESYREGLIAMAADLGVQDQVCFVNEYLPLDDLLEYYEACDIYLTPHIDPQQVSSGTLAYALGMGKACISTPYVYAKEMLINDRGMLVGFRSGQDIAEAAISLFADPAKLTAMENKAYALGRTMSWPRVAERYLNLFRMVREVHETVESQA